MRWRAAAVTFGGAEGVASGLSFVLLPSVLPQVAEEFGVDYATLGFVTALPPIAYLIAAFFTNQLITRISSRVALPASLVVGALAFMGVASAPSIWLIALLGAVHGAAAAITWAAIVDAAGGLIELPSLPKVLAASGAGTAAGSLLSAFIVATLIGSAGWRAGFVLAAVVTVLIAIAVGWFLWTHKETQDAASAGDQVSLAEAISVVRTDRPARTILIVGGLAGLVGIPFTNFLSALLQDELGASEAFTSGAWLLLAIVGLVVGPLAGVVAVRLSGGVDVITVSSVFAVGLLVLVGAWTAATVLVAAVGFSGMYYSVWGLLSAQARSTFTRAMSLRLVTMGLVGFSLGGGVGNALVGRWFHAVGSLRPAYIAMTAATAAMALVARGLRGEDDRDPVGRTAQRPI